MDPIPLTKRRWARKAFGGDPPPAGIGGDNETIQNGAYGWGEDAAFDITNLSVYRQVLDFDDLDAWARHRLVPMRPVWEVDR